MNNAELAADYCPRCDYDEHVCGGCGEPLKHSEHICNSCRAEVDK